MSIKFRVIERGYPGVVGGGTKKWYATSVSSGEMSLEEATAAIEESSTVSGADIRAVLYALVSLMSKSLAKGEIVRLGDLGSLRMSISSKAEATADEVASSCITGGKNNLYPRSQAERCHEADEVRKELLIRGLHDLKKTCLCFPKNVSMFF